MRILTFPLHYVRKKQARRRQVRTVLHMLAVSGVIRPSHIEPRYFEPSSHVDALYRQNAKLASPSINSVGRRSFSLEWTKFRQLVHAIRPSRLQIEQ